MSWLTGECDSREEYESSLDNKTGNLEGSDAQVFTVQPEVNQIEHTKGWAEQGQEWSNSVHKFNGVPFTFTPMKYFEFMRDLYQSISSGVSICGSLFQTHGERTDPDSSTSSESDRSLHSV